MKKKSFSFGKKSFGSETDTDTNGFGRYFRPIPNFGRTLLSCILDAVTSSGILKAKQKLGVTFNSDKLGGIDFTKFSKLSMCSAGAGRCWLVQWPGLPPRHCTWSVLKFL